MKEKNKRSKKARVAMQFSTFEIPPSGDVLVLGKRCSIGPQAAKRMIDSAAPDQFDLIQIEDDIIEAILVKKFLFLRTEKEPLVKAIVEESRAIMGTGCMVRVKCEVVVTVDREF